MEGRRSGLIKAFGGWRSPLIADYHRTDGTLTLWDGSRVFIDGANDGAFRVQGENLSGAWCDEIGLWRPPYWDIAWNESLWPAVRIAPGKIVATGTPKMGHGLVKQLIDDPRVPVTRMRTIDNIANLSPEEVRELYDRHQGTRRGRQELEGEFLEDVPGALWTRMLLDSLRVDAHPDLSRVVVAVDPAVTADRETGSSETGIVVAGYSSHHGRGYVLADRTCMMSPHGWASEAVRAYHEFRADRIVAEKNQGGDMVAHTLRTVDRNVPVKLVTATRGKRVRAEPIAALYEQGKVHHVGPFVDLEDQMVSWTPDDPVSPDRMDALVWALTELMLRPATVDATSYHGDGAEPVVRRGDLVLIGAKYIDAG